MRHNPGVSIYFELYLLWITRILQDQLFQVPEAIHVNPLEADRQAFFITTYSFAGGAYAYCRRVTVQCQFKVTISINFYRFVNSKQGAAQADVNRMYVANNPAFGYKLDAKNRTDPGKFSFIRHGIVAYSSIGSSPIG